MGVFNEAVAKSAMVRLVIDMKNNAEEWWDGGGRDLWDMVNQQYDGTWGEVILPRENAEQFLLYAKKIPGWKSKSAISSVPIMMYDVDDDE